MASEAGRFRPILGRDDGGAPVLANEFTDYRDNKTQSALLFRAGVIVSLSRKFVLRSGFSYLRRYADERGSKGLEVGAGYRF